MILFVPLRKVSSIHHHYFQFFFVALCNCTILKMFYFCHVVEPTKTDNWDFVGWKYIRRLQVLNLFNGRLQNIKKNIWVEFTVEFKTAKISKVSSMPAGLTNFWVWLGPLFWRRILGNKTQTKVFHTDISL